MAAALLARRVARVGAPGAQTLLTAPRFQRPKFMSGSMLLTWSSSLFLALLRFTSLEVRCCLRFRRAAPRRSRRPPPLLAVHHGAIDPRAAEFILSRRAAAVVVESSSLDLHQRGVAVGRELMRKIYKGSRLTTVSRSYKGLDGAARLGVELESHPEPSARAEWAEGCRSIDCEHLVWAAAHIVDAKVHYGDVPKVLTAQRLAALSPADLCDGFAALFAESLSRWLPGFPMPEHEVRRSRLAACF